MSARDVARAERLEEIRGRLLEVAFAGHSRSGATQGAADAARDAFIARAAEDMKYLLDLVEQHESEGKQS